MRLLETAFERGQRVAAVQIPDVSCPRCGGPLSFVNARPPGATGLHAMALFACPDATCTRLHGDWELRVELIPTRKARGPDVGWTGLPSKGR